MIIDSSELKKLSNRDLEDIGGKLGFKSPDSSRGKKEDLIKFILGYMHSRSENKQKRESKYKIVEQIGNAGKEGITYLVIKNKIEYAMKTFKKKKSSQRISKEAELQKKAADANISPKIFDVDLDKKFIVMEKMDQHLTDKITQQKGNLNISQQKQIIKIFKTLDKVKVFHADSNMLNYMILDNKIYIIDFGMSKDIDEKLGKKLGTNTPNIDLMTIGFILKLKEFNCLPSSYSYLLNFVSPENKEKFNM